MAAVEAILLLAKTLPADERLDGSPPSAHRYYRRLLLALVRLLAGRDGVPLSRRRSRTVRGTVDGDPTALYEELLALAPRLDCQRQLTLEPIRGSLRKRWGSYSTPLALVEPLLRSALVPIFEARGSETLPRVCDPACGGGRFLLAAGRRMMAGSKDRDAVVRCLFGVDRDPLAVELCRHVLQSAFGNPDVLAVNIRCGNSLIGWPPSLPCSPDADDWTVRHLGGGPRDELRSIHGFFHWPRELSDVLAEGGFDVVLGNPPWERVKHQAEEWRASGGTTVDAEADRRRAVQTSRFLRRSGRFPLGARGDLNCYGPFVELSRDLVRPGGRVGLVVPSGLATDVSMKELFASLMRDGLVSWFDFHNRGRLFPSVEGNFKFGLLTLERGRRGPFMTAGQLTDPAELDRPERLCELTPERIALVNPNTLHCPSFAGRTDAELVGKLHERFGVLVRKGGANRWGVRLWTMFHMTRDAGLFSRKQRSGLLPLYEAKLIRAWDHRGATFAGVAEADRYRIHAGTRPLSTAGECVVPRYWVAEEAVRARAGDARWFLGFRNAISAVADARSLVAAVVPRAGVGNSLPLIAGLDARRACLMLALLNSFVVDYVLRQKASGGNLNFHVLEQLPVPDPEALDDGLARRALELIYTSDELRDFARQCGHRGRPFAVDEERRRRLTAEIDVSLFRVYGLTRREVEHVLGSFPVLERREVRRFGRFRTRDDILERFGG